MGVTYLSSDQLNDMLQTVATQVVIGGKYKHYKGQFYIVTGLVIWEESNKPAVVYRADYPPYVSFARPLTVWLEKVDVGGELVPRFQLVQ